MAVCLRCSLWLNDSWHHTRQVVVGFCELRRKGLVKLDLVHVRQSRRIRRAPILRAQVEGRNVIYDVRDGYNFLDSGGFDATAFHKSLDDVDYYFKRSYDPSRHNGLPNEQKMRPLGLNYRVALAGFHPYVWEYPWDARRLLEVLVGREPSIRSFETPPTADNGARVLFMTRVWDPDEASGDQRHERQVINDMRADCIRACRKEFGAAFVGGLAVDGYSIRNYPDCLLTSNAASGKRHFLREVQRSTVCVATTGLHGSIGWKMAEYVAASKAIVSEPLLYVLPGGFAKERNYLEFSSVEGLVAATKCLLKDAVLRHDMMRANWGYYQSWVRPDALVMNSIMSVLEG